MNARQKPKLGRAVWEAALREYGHLSDVDLAKKLGVTPPSVAYQRRRAGYRRVWVQTPPAPPTDAAPQAPKPRRQQETRNAQPVRDWPEIFRVYGHLNNRKIGAIVGVTYQAVSLQRRKLGLEGPYKRRDMQEWARIFAANPGKTNRELAEVAGLDVGDNTLSRARKVLGIPPPPPQPPRLKCTPEQVVALQGRTNSLTDSEIAERLGCHPSTVYMVRRKHGIPSGRELQRRSREAFE